METQQLIWCDSRHSSSKHIALPSRWNWFVLLHEKAKRKQTPKEWGRLPWSTLIFWNYCISAGWQAVWWSPVGILCILVHGIYFHTSIKWSEDRNSLDLRIEFRLHIQKKQNKKLTWATAGTENEWMIWANTCSPTIIPRTARRMWCEVVPLLLGFHYSLQ